MVCNHWEGLVRFLDGGRIELDTNIVERGIRPIVLNRKNALFAGHDEGAENWACVASLIETCKLNDVEPHAYIADVLDKLVNLWPASRIDELMPWAWPKAHAAHRICGRRARSKSPPNAVGREDRLRLGSLSPCSISFSDQIPTGARADCKTGTVICRCRYEFDTAALSKDIGFSFSPRDPSAVVSFETPGAEIHICSPPASRAAGVS